MKLIISDTITEPKIDSKKLLEQLGISIICHHSEHKTYDVSVDPNKFTVSFNHGWTIVKSIQTKKGFKSCVGIGGVSGNNLMAIIN